MKTLGLPVLIEDMIKKVTDPNASYTQKQHYIETLRRISEETNKAIVTAEQQRR